MAKGYWIGRIDVHNADEYAKYATANQAAFKKYGAKYVVRGGEPLLVEGSYRKRNVVIEFPTYEVAVECYNSPEYKAACEFRKGQSVADLIIIPGYEGAQP